jgi:hypothetical protein
MGILLNRIWRNRVAVGCGGCGCGNGGIEALSARRGRPLSVAIAKNLSMGALRSEIAV